MRLLEFLQEAIARSSENEVVHHYQIFKVKLEADQVLTRFEKTDILREISSAFVSMLERSQSVGNLWAFSIHSNDLIMMPEVVSALSRLRQNYPRFIEDSSVWISLLNRQLGMPEDSLDVLDLLTGQATSEQARMFIVYRYQEGRWVERLPILHLRVYGLLPPVSKYPVLSGFKLPSRMVFCVLGALLL